MSRPTKKQVWEALNKNYPSMRDPMDILHEELDILYALIESEKYMRDLEKVNE